MPNRSSLLFWFLVSAFAACNVHAVDGTSPGTPCEILLHEGTDFGSTHFPSEVVLDLRRSQLKTFLNTSEELWSQGFAPERLADVLEKVAVQEPLSDREALELKQMRSRMKQLRFALRMFDKKHRPPLILHTVTRLLGQVKDALINANSELAQKRAQQLLPRLKSEKWHRLAHEIDEVKLCRRKSLVQHLLLELDQVREVLDKDTLTPHQFHDARKVVSGLLALFEIADKSGVPRSENEPMMEYLSTLNSRMGDMHNNMIAQDYRGELDYDDSHFTLPADLRDSLQELVGGFDALLREP